MMSLSNENLMWISLGVWLLFVLFMGYQVFFFKPTQTVQKAPSGSDIILAGGS